MTENQVKMDLAYNPDLKENVKKIDKKADEVAKWIADISNPELPQDNYVVLAEFVNRLTSDVNDLQFPNGDPKDADR